MASNKRIRMIAKMIPCTRYPTCSGRFVFMNKRFMTQAVMARFDNRPVKITPDDLEGRMIVAYIFLGAATRQQKIVNMQQILAILGQLQQIGIPPNRRGNGKEFHHRDYGRDGVEGCGAIPALIWSRIRKRATN